MAPRREEKKDVIGQWAGSSVKLEAGVDGALQGRDGSVKLRSKLRVEEWSLKSFAGLAGVMGSRRSWR